MPAAKGLFGDAVAEYNKPSKKSDGHAAPVATGPFGLTCETCKHIVRVIIRSGKAFYKCRLMEKHWTHGAGSDIRRKDWACRFWEQRREYPQ